MIDLAGGRIVILGGSSGIGLAVARLAATLGARVTLLSRSANKFSQASALLPDAVTMASPYAAGREPKETLG